MKWVNDLETLTRARQLSECMSWTGASLMNPVTNCTVEQEVLKPKTTLFLFFTYIYTYPVFYPDLKDETWSYKIS